MRGLMRAAACVFEITFSKCWKMLLKLVGFLMWKAFGPSPEAAV